MLKKDVFGGAVGVTATPSPPQKYFYRQLILTREKTLSRFLGALDRRTGRKESWSQEERGTERVGGKGFIEDIKDCVAVMVSFLVVRCGM